MFLRKSMDWYHFMFGNWGKCEPTRFRVFVETEIDVRTSLVFSIRVRVTSRSREERSDQKLLDARYRDK